MHLGELVKQLPSDLLACVCLAREKSCSHILFDRDAEHDEDLDEFSDETGKSSPSYSRQPSDWRNS